MTALDAAAESADLPPAERRISRRIAAITESATLAVDAKAKALKAAGKPVIGFGAGEPDFPTPDYIVEAAIEACRLPAMHRYTPAGGLPALKEAIVAKTARDSGLQVTPANVLVTNGGKQAVYEAFATMLDPGDEVLLPAPYCSVPLLAWMEQGGVYAVANLGGGGEYGREWHEAGTKLKKQNVFNDFITAAEYLVAQRYTSSPKLTIAGGSNGGLLVGAVL